MSSIKTETIRSNDKLVLKVSLALSYQGDYEHITVEFRGENELNHIITTSQGYIVNDRIHLRIHEKQIEASIYYPDSMFDCLISYLTGEELVHYEKLSCEPEPRERITPTLEEIQSIEAANSPFDMRMFMFKQSLKNRKTLWRLKLEIINDLVISVVQEGNKKVNIVLGDDLAQISSYDYIFPIYPGTKRVVIPKEICWKRYHQYPVDALLCCCEIVKANFHSIKHLYYKMPVSNKIVGSSIPKMKQPQLEKFKSPTGSPLGPTGWAIEIGMPIYTGKQ